MLTKTKLVKMTGYRIQGIAKIRDWYFNQGYIPMTPYSIDELNNEEVISGINDSGFGCESLLGAKVDIYEQYEYGVLEYLETRYYDLDSGGEYSLTKTEDWPTFE